MGIAALIISIIAIFGSGYSLFLQKKAHDREKRREQRDTYKNIRYEADYSLTENDDYSITHGYPKILGAKITLKAFNIGMVKILIDHAFLLDSAENRILEIKPYDKEFEFIESGETAYFQFYINYDQEECNKLVHEEKVKLLIIDQMGEKYIIHKIKKYDPQ